MSKPTREQLKEKYGDETVRVVDSAYVNSVLSGKQGIIPAEDKQFWDIYDLLNSQAFLMPRYEAEYNPEYRQFVNYCVLESKGKIYVTERINRAGDVRIDSKLSVCVGGHVNGLDTRLYDELSRELEEELYFTDVINLQYFAFIHDSSDEVSRDHLGMISIGVPNNPLSVRIRETDKLIGSWLTIERKHNIIMDSMENWSYMLFNYLLDNKTLFGSYLGGDNNV